MPVQFFFLLRSLRKSICQRNVLNSPDVLVAVLYPIYINVFLVIIYLVNWSLASLVIYHGGSFIYLPILCVDIVFYLFAFFLF